jgi:toxin FitB
VFILDTMVVSERTKPRPNASVRAWLNTLEPASQFVSAISIGEISFGIRRMGSGRDKRRLEAWLSGELIPLFAGRILSVDVQVAERWGILRHEVGRSLSAADSLIGATALVHGLAVATRNERDFDDLGVRVINPWLA